MSEWQTSTIGEIAEVFDGPHATPQKTADGPWFLSISSLDHGRLNLTESAHLSENDFRQWTRRVTPLPGDVLISYETRLGEAAIMLAGLQACLGRRMALLRSRNGKVHSRFLLYAYLAPQFQKVIRQRMIHGATVDRIPLTDLPDWPIAVPPLSEQVTIANVLGALDDKIAVNERTAGVCHEMADLYYKDAMRNGSSVPLPVLVAPILGGTPDRTVGAYWGPPHLWASAKDVAASSYGTLISTEEQITDLAVEDTKAKPIAKGSVVLTARGTLGAVARVCQATSLNQSCYAFTADVLAPGVLYFTMRSASQQMLRMAQGTVFSTVNMKTFEHIEVASLSSQELGALEGRIAPLLDVVEDRLRENDLLKQLRDALLPRLMSGEIRVRDAEQIVKDAT